MVPAELQFEVRSPPFLRSKPAVSFVEGLFLFWKAGHSPRETPTEHEPLQCRHRLLHRTHEAAATRDAVDISTVERGVRQGCVSPEPVCSTASTAEALWAIRLRYALQPNMHAGPAGNETCRRAPRLSCVTLRARSGVLIQQSERHVVARLCPGPRISPWVTHPIIAKPPTLKNRGSQGCRSRGPMGIEREEPKKPQLGPQSDMVADFLAEAVPGPSHVRSSSNPADWLAGVVTVGMTKRPPTRRIRWFAPVDAGPHAKKGRRPPPGLPLLLHRTIQGDCPWEAHAAVQAGGGEKEAEGDGSRHPPIGGR